MATTRDLRSATRMTDRVKKLAYREFGFREYLVRPLEADSYDPSNYCLFEVNGTTYRVDDGELSIVRPEGE